MTQAQTESLRRLLDACPSANHVSAFAAAELQEIGFIGSTGGMETQKGFVRSGGTLIAWNIPKNSLASGLRIIGAHTDSPGIHIKPSPDFELRNWRMLGVEVYGGVLLNSWLDRDLGIAGHAVVAGGQSHLFASYEGLARISQLAIHLDREVNERGLILNRQQHLTPTWATSKGMSFKSWVASQCDISESEIVAIDAQLFDVNPSAVIGQDKSMLTSARLDNQVSCWAALEALKNCGGQHASVVAMFDHEEVGSQSATGASGPLLERTIEQIAIAQGLDRSGYLKLLANSHCVSADNAHAVHPNYPERHDAQHSPLINGGPVIKFNTSQRYATSATAILPFASACAAANVQTQEFASRNDIACGTTIGPITATRLGIATIDVGVPQLSMHSIREVCGVNDIAAMQQALTAYLNRLGK